MSRMAAVTRMPSALSSGLSMISIGKALPSLRRPVSSMPVPICWARASSAERRSSASSRSAKPSGNDVRDLLPDELVAAVAELLLGLEVEQDDLAGLVDDDDRVRGRLEQPAVASLHVGQVQLGRLADADVADGRRDEDALGALERAEHDLDREGAAVLAPAGELDPGPDLLGQGVLGGAQVVGEQPLGEALRE